MTVAYVQVHVERDYSSELVLCSNDDGDSIFLQWEELVSSVYCALQGLS